MSTTAHASTTLSRPPRGDRALREAGLASADEKPTIVLLTSDEGLAGIIERMLARNGYPVTTAGSLTGLSSRDGRLPSLILLDRRLKLLDQLRRQPQLRTIPLVAVLPAGHQFSEEDHIQDLEQGYDLVFCSDRYRELVAQIRAMFRRQAAGANPCQVLRAGHLAMDLARYEVSVGNEPRSVTNKEFEILRQLLLMSGHVLSRQDLLNRVWGEDYALEEHALDVHIHALRRKIEPDPSKPRFIVTVRGIGYKLQVD